jgi:hypothetical protein
MSIQKQIQEYINSQSEVKKTDLSALHKQIQEALPGCELWFLDGKNEEGKIVTKSQYWLWSIHHTLCRWQHKELLSNWLKCKHHRNFGIYYGLAKQDLFARNVWAKNWKSKCYWVLY